MFIKLIIWSDGRRELVEDFMLCAGIDHAAHTARAWPPPIPPPRIERISADSRVLAAVARARSTCP
jgi:hypothetical protein